MDDILRFNGALKRDSQVDSWLKGSPVPLRTIARLWFEHMRQCGDDVVELMHDGCPTVCVEDAGFAYVNSFKDHVNVGFFRGNSLDDPYGLLEGTGKRMRHVKLWPDREVNAAALRDLIEASYVDIRMRLGIADGSRKKK